jgi:hypothetical protein
MNEVVMLVMTGGPRGTPIERMVTEACEAATLDTVERALAAPAVSRIVVATDSPGLSDALAGLADPRVTADLDPPGERFHFGARLMQLTHRYHIQRVLYFGGGSGVLLSSSEIDRLARALAGADRLFVCNNFFSADFAGWTPADAMADLLTPRFDNELGWLLGDLAGLPVVALDRTASTQFDLDTPTDLLTVAAHPAVGPRLRAHIDDLHLDPARLNRAIATLNDSRAEVIIAGRISATAWSYLEADTACRTRVWSEERGMRADGRLFRAEARSLLGYLLERTGLDEGFALLAELGQAAFIDSRVLLAHFAHWPPTAERFASDLGRPDLITHSWLRDFTTAALAAPIPIVLGGHSLVAGGLYALVEAALARADDTVRRRPDLSPPRPDPLAPWLT